MSTTTDKTSKKQDVPDISSLPASNFLSTSKPATGTSKNNTKSAKSKSLLNKPAINASPITETSTTAASTSGLKWGWFIWTLLLFLFFLILFVLAYLGKNVFSYLANDMQHLVDNTRAFFAKYGLFPSLASVSVSAKATLTETPVPTPGSPQSPLLATNMAIGLNDIQQVPGKAEKMEGSLINPSPYTNTPATEPSDLLNTALNTGATKGMAPSMGMMPKPAPTQAPLVTSTATISSAVVVPTSATAPVVVSTANLSAPTAPANAEAPVPAPDGSSSVSGKVGWCFIGDQQGYGSCMRVGLNDTCMSGDIFPSKDVCINQHLRY